MSAVPEFLYALEQASVSPRWHGGVLHIQMDDGNLEFDSGIVEGQTQWYGRTLTREDHILAGMWDRLSRQQRKLAFALWNLKRKEAEIAADGVG